MKLYLLYGNNKLLATIFARKFFKNASRQGSLQKYKKHEFFHALIRPPPPFREKKTDVFFLILDHYWGILWKENVLFLLEMSNTCKTFQNPKICKKYRTPIFTQKFCFTRMTQIGLKWIFFKASLIGFRLSFLFGR